MNNACANKIVSDTPNRLKYGKWPGIANDSAELKKNQARLASDFGQTFVLCKLDFTGVIMKISSFW